MKTYKDITKKYLVENKGRTILTICGIILSVALMTSIMLFVRGIHQTFLDREIDKSGDYHIGFGGLSKEDYDKMSMHLGVEQVGILNNITEEGMVEGAKYDVKMVVKEMSKDSQDLFPFDLENGRFAENDKEVVIETMRADELLKDIGEKITIEVDGKKNEYTIVGLIDEQNDYFRIKAGTAVLYNDDLSPASGFTAFKAKNTAIRETIDELASMTSAESTENRYLLNYLGASTDTSRNLAMGFMAAIIISMVVICTVLVIRNAFYISIVSRMKEFGLLKAIGATSKQLKKMILKEANIIAAIAIPFGLFFGTVAIIVIEKVLKHLSGASYLSIAIQFDWWIYAIAAVLGLVTTYFSALLPAREISKVSAVEAIDNRKNIKKENIKRKRFSIVEKFCGIRTIMAYRNIKRNKKRYVATVLSLSICMIMIIVFASYMKTVKNDMLGYTSAAMETHDMSVYVHNEPQEKINGFVEGLQKIENVKVYESMARANGLVSVIAKDNQVKTNVVDGHLLMERYSKKSGYTMMVDADIQATKLNDNTVDLLNKYIIDGKIDKEYMEKNNGIIIVSDILYYGNGSSDKYKGSLYNHKVGDSLYINKTLNEEHTGEGDDYIYTKENTLEYEVVAIVSELPEKLFDQVEFIVDYDNFKEVAKGVNEERRESFEYMLGTDELILDIDDKLDDKGYEKIKAQVDTIAKEYNIKLFNEKEMLEENAQFMKQIEFLIYGFITVITLISCTNIFNTMSTNILFRKSELAALRAIGMSKKEIRNMVVKEGLLYGGISAMYGVGVGVTINYMLHMLMKQAMGMEMIFNPNFEIIAIVVLIATVVGVLSSLLPLRKLDKATIIEDLKGE